LKEVREDAERRIGALSRRNLDVEADMGQLDAQYKQLNQKSTKLSQQDADLRRLDVDLTAVKGQKQDLEL
jgi:progesterone-induced-blocking factor 1